VAAQPESKTSTLRTAIYWIIVLIPLGWGIYESIVKSLPLFRASADRAGTRDSASR
jgi:hypothetical protein